MREATIDAALCDGCQDCIDVCCYEAITLTRVPSQKRLKARVDPQRCCGCNLCPSCCPQEGIEMVPLRSS